MHFGKQFIAQKKLESGGGSPIWTPYPDLEGPGPGVLLEPCYLTFEASL